jgi:hypothetical protein
MDNDILFINSVLVSSKIGLTTSDISKLIFEKYGVKISRTIVKNYLWSYFRHIIQYNQSDYTYKLDNDNFLLDDIEVSISSSVPRPISSSVVGGKIKITVDEAVSKEDFLKGITILNYKLGSNQRNTDLIKRLNRVIEQLKDYG